MWDTEETRKGRIEQTKGVEAVARNWKKNKMEEDKNRYNRKRKTKREEQEGDE
jgi:hypothetical protein